MATKETTGKLSNGQIVYLSAGVPVTNSALLAEAVGCSNDRIVILLCGLQAAEIVAKEDYKDLQRGGNGKDPLVELTERSALMILCCLKDPLPWANRIRVIDAFAEKRTQLAMEREVREAPYKDRSLSFRMMQVALSEVAKTRKIKLKRDHLLHEVLLVHQTVIGDSWMEVDHTCLPPCDARMVVEVASRNAVLIACGYPYEERKKLLLAFAHELRMAQLSARARSQTIVCHSREK